jgi:hypothetical protein
VEAVANFVGAEVDENLGTVHDVGRDGGLGNRGGWGIPGKSGEDHDEDAADEDRAHETEYAAEQAVEPAEAGFLEGHRKELGEQDASELDEEKDAEEAQQVCEGFLFEVWSEEGCRQAVEPACQEYRKDGCGKADREAEETLPDACANGDAEDCREDEIKPVHD